MKLNHLRSILETIDKEAKKTETNPSEDQKESGNYKKGHIDLHGLDISIENPKGSKRSGTDATGKKWSTTIAHHYGYIKGTKGKDKDHIDVFIGPDAEEDLPVFVVDQVNKSGKFDEHKIMMGFKDRQAAKKGYLASYEEGWTGLGNMTTMNMDEFKEWLDGDTTRPVHDLKSQ